MRRDKKEVRSGQEAGFSAEPTRIDMQSSSTRSLDETARQTSAGRRIVGVLASGLGRRSSSHYSPTDSPNSPSLLVRRHFAFPILAVLAVAALGLWLLLPGGALRAQDAAIEYPENGDEVVATFTATDPEGRTIYWSLLPANMAADLNNDGDTDDTGEESGDNPSADAADFSISEDGVLTFNIPPDHENADDDGTDNEYDIVLVASDDAPGAGTDDDPINMGYKKVVVEVTDMDEPGVVALSSLQPQIGVTLTATLMDDDATDAQIAAAEWKWEKSQDMSSWAPIDGAGVANTHEVGSTADDYYLRVTATYTDSHGLKKPAEAVSANKVRMAPTTTDADAAFPDATDANDRSVDENSPAGTNVGKPVEASDTVDDVLTYSLTGANTGGFEIDPRTGQITVGPRTVLDADETVLDADEADTDEYNVMVTVTEAGKSENDSSPRTQMQAVTITVKNLNEAPMVIGGVTRVSHEENIVIATAVSTYTATDAEISGDTCVMASCTWSVSGTDAGDFEIGNGDGITAFGELTFKKVPNYEMPADANRDNVYMVTVVVTDVGVDEKNKMTATRDVVITVKNVEEDGTVTLTAQQPKIGVELTASVTDIDGDVTNVTWTWERDDNDTDADPNAGDEEVIKGATSATYTPTDDDMGQYLRAIASYTDGKGKDTSMATSANVVVVRTDNPPKFPTTEDGKRSILENSAAEINVGTSVQAEDAETTQLLTYSLSGPDMDSFTITSDMSEANRGGQISVASGTKLDYETKSTYRVTVTATDPGDLSASIDVTITVDGVDEAPEVTGDAKKDYAENGIGMVARYTAVDPEDRTIYWSLLSTLPSPVPMVEGALLSNNDFEDNGDFSISADGVLTFNILPDYETLMGGGPSDDSNTYKVVVVASDDAPGAGTDDDPINMGYKRVVVDVTDVDEPGMVTLSSLQPQISVELTATLTDAEASDAEVNGAEWKWEKSRSRSSGWTAIDGAGTENMYTPGEATTGYYLRAMATYDDTDDNERTPQAVSVNKVREAPATTDEEAAFPDATDANDRSVDENSPAGTNVGKPVEASDTVDDVLTYSLTGANTGGFEIDPRTGQITVGPRTVLDADEADTDEYTVTVTVTEASGDTTATSPAVTITVKNLNEAPMVTGGVTMLKSAESDSATALAGATYTALDPESSETNDVCTDTSRDSTCTWSLEGADSGKFSISDAGVLAFRKAPNYEKPTDAGMNNVYNVTVVVTDSGVNSKNKMTAMREVTIMVTNVEEAGTVTLTAQQPKVGVEIEAMVTDLDGDVTNVTWEWERDDDRDNQETNGGMEEVIKDATSATYTPTNDDISDAGFYLRAIASYTDGKGKDTSMETTAAIVVVRTDNPPKFPTTEDGKRSIEEGMTSDVGDPVTAMDDDENQVLTYSLSGADMASFTIAQTDDETTNDVDEEGLISVASGTKLDYETKKTYMVTVTATDPDGLSASIDVTITVTDVNEAPEIIVGGLAITGPASASYAEDRSDPVGTYDLAGPDSDSGRWTTLGGADASDFRISTGGALTFARTPDFENPADADENNVYMVTLNATDSEGNTDTHNVVVRVTDIDDTPTIGGTLLETYDADDSGKIERVEVLDAIDDFFDPTNNITREEVLDVIDLFFAGLGS